MQRLGVLLATGAVLALASPALIKPNQNNQHVSTTQLIKGQQALTEDHILGTGEPPGSTGTSREMARVKRLTSFGRPAEVPAPAPKQGKGRECKQDADCGPIPYTSCLADTRDGKKRCLCSDYTPPVNGNCKQKNRVKRGYVPPGNVNRDRENEDSGDDKVPVVLFEPVKSSFFPEDRPRTEVEILKDKPLFSPRSPYLRQSALYERCDADSDCLEGGECRANGNATANIGKNVRICLCQPGRIEDKKMCNGSEGLGNGYHMAIAFSALALILRFSPN